MRLFALLFSLYLACLSCLPCADEVQTCVEPTQTSISATSHSDCGRNALGDWCSPLCQCHCCAGTVVGFAGAAPLGFSRPAQWAAGPCHARLIVVAPTRVAAAIWQPPRA
ncbi:hypothetical protein FY528_19400 [Hymenobacter lutimineralis]|uniref:Secreted protein n=1 Tax=Hymenobacter lutimineralis TaxID=2606448 RepID=A0A5D6UUI0_9BACT|nr:DUF6660 family protein [Hymenobacter lutimineralis]TYZ06094.1 hypothetical protein FY528_19400 [Hymenobacter lutimineralis]